MANFAREQLMKYGWTEGKGLGKNENGITEPVRLATSQNKAGIGYDETEAWWEKLFNNATKNVKVESHNDEVSLSIIDDIDPTRFGNEQAVLSNRLTRQKFIGPESTTCPLAFDQELNVVCHGKTTGRNLTLGGKLERIARQDRVLLNNSQCTTLSKNDMAYRKVNAESDVEENEQEVDNNKSILRSEEGDGFIMTKSKKKQHRKKMNKLLEKLGTCNLGNSEEIISQSIESWDVTNDNSTSSNISIATKVSSTSCTDSSCGENYGNHDVGRRRSNLEENYIKHYLSNRKLCQKMKKSKEKSVDSSMMLNCLKNSTVNKLYLKPFRVSTFNVNTNVHNCMQVKTVFNSVSKKNCISQFKTIPRVKFETEEDGWLKVVVSPDLGKRRADKQSKKWEKYDIEEKIQQRDNYSDLIVPSIYKSKQDSSQLKILNSSKRDIQSHIDEEREHNVRRLNNKIQRKKERRCRSKLKKITEKLKGEALAHELNSVIKNLTAFDLTEEVNANTIKKKLTQTHLTPV